MFRLYLIIYTNSNVESYYSNSIIIFIEKHINSMEKLITQDGQTISEEDLVL